MSDIDLSHEAIEHTDDKNPPRDKRVALIISVFAVFLAMTEILGQNAQATAVENNIEAASQWAFFQARAERETTYAVAIDALQALGDKESAETKGALRDAISKWQQSVERLHNDPQKNSGTIQLFQRARAAEVNRDLAKKKHHRYELASALLHIGIVLASASIITGMPFLVGGAFGFGGMAVVFVFAGIVGW